MCSKVLEPQFSKLGLGKWAAFGPKNWELAQPSRHPLGRGARWSGSYGNTDAGIPKPGPAARNVGDGGLAWGSCSEPGVDTLATSRSTANPL